MATKANEPRKEANDSFGLPKAEFKPIEYGNKNWLKITAIIVSLVLIVSTGLIYWFFFRTTPTEAPLVEEQELQEEISDVDFIENELPEESFEETPISEPAPAPQPPPAPVQSSPKGTVTKITTPQGHYYVIVSSFVDGALAEDHAKRLARKGASAIILSPKANTNYYRVAVAQGSTLAEANAILQEHKATHGNDLWILKY